MSRLMFCLKCFEMRHFLFWKGYASCAACGACRRVE